MYKREYGDYIEDKVDAMDKAMQFTENMDYSDFIHDDKTIFAVIRALCSYRLLTTKSTYRT